ncbi:MAG: permease [Candidatus Cloacimonadales bacterium]
MKKQLKFGFYLLYFVFIIAAFFLQYSPGIEISKNFLSFTWSMLKVVPVAFILIGLFDVWIKKETIEKHLGEKSTWKAYFWIILLSATTVGGMYVAFPIAAALHRKGARLGLVFAYLTAAAVFRIPMSIFEATFLGFKFTLIRFLVTLPLLIISSELLEKLVLKRAWKKDMFR